MTVEPIKPEAIPFSNIPEAVIEVFNTLIAKHYHGGQSIVLQNEVIEALAAKGYGRQELFDNHYLDIEPLYEGDWIVTYDKPAFNEDYPASFTFKARR